jgi:hypothetical protein
MAGIITMVLRFGLHQGDIHGLSGKEFETWINT